MGVAGLYSWMRANENRFGERVDLCKTKLIIDANCILHILYEIPSLLSKCDQFRHDIYGGNLVLYGKMVSDLFKRFKDCSIEPILVYDGSVLGKKALFGLVDIKSSEAHRRGLGDFKVMGQSQDEPNKALDLSSTIIRNHLINIVFRNIARDFDIEQVVVARDADGLIVALSNEHNCPILSNDTDFLMYPLKIGYIYLDQHNQEEFLGSSANEDRSKISCSIYNRNKLIEHFPGLSPCTLPILSAMLGRGYDPRLHFERIGRNLNLDRKQDYEHINSKNLSHRRIANLLAFLQDKKSLDDAVQAIKNSPVISTPQERQYVQEIMESIIKRFDVDSQKFHSELYNVLTNRYPPINRYQLQPVEFLVDLMERGSMTGSCLDLIFKTVQYPYKILDDWRLPSAGLVLQRPFRLALILLRPDSRDRESFQYYDRVRDRYTKIILGPINHLEGIHYLSSLNIYTMLELEPNQRKGLLMSCFHLTRDDLNKLESLLSKLFIQDFLEEAILCFALALKYVAIESGNYPRQEYVQALLLTLLYYASLENKLQYATENNELFDTWRALLMENIEIHTKMRNGKTYLPKDNSLYRNVMHSIVQLQLAYKAYNLINSLLQTPLHKPRHEKFFNSPLIFRLTKLLITGEMNLETVVGCDSFTEFFEDLFEFSTKSNGRFNGGRFLKKD